MANGQDDKSQTLNVYGDSPKGLLVPGNIDLNNRPIIKNDDGSISTEYSYSFGDEKGREVLVPTIVNGKFLTPDGKKPPEGKTVNGKYVPSPEEEAMFKLAQAHYEDTGEHMGIFDSPDNANSYAENAHNREDPRYNFGPKMNGDVQQPDTTNIDAQAAAQGMQQQIPPQLLQQMDQAQAQQAGLQAPNLRDMAMPNIARFISQMIRPTASVQPGQSADQLRPPSRLDAFENFLGTFMEAFAQGMQHSGTGPGANARGFGSAVLAPQQQAIQQFGLNQQAQQAQQGAAQAQAQLAETQARTQQMTETVNTPVGPLPIAVAARLYPAEVQAQSRAANTQAVTARDLALKQEGGQQAMTLQRLRGTQQAENTAAVTARDLQVARIRAQAVQQQLKIVIGQDGQPQYVPRAQAVGMTPGQALAGTERVKLQKNDVALQNAIPRVQNLLQNSDVISSMLDAGKIAMSIGADGTLQAVVGRNVKLTPKEAKYASDFQTMTEDINLLREPMGATGFRSTEAFNALQAQRGRLMQNPEVSKGVLQNTLSAMMGLHAVNQEALSVKGTPSGGGTTPSVQDLLKKYPPK